MKAKTIQGHSPEEIRSLVKESMQDGFRPTLALVFVPSVWEKKEACAFLEAEGISVVGASSYGNFINRDFSKESIVAMLLEVNRDYFRILFKETGNSNTYDIAKQIGNEAATEFRNPAFIVVSGGITTDGEVIVKGILDGVGKNALIFGGLAASDLELMHTCVFNGKQEIDNGIAAIVFDSDKISVKGLAIGGWKSLGLVRTVTKSEGNIVYTIDDFPAMDIVLRYSGVSLDKLEDKTNILRLASAFQLELQRENANPIMRTPMHADPINKSIFFSGSVPQGSKVKFCILPGFEVIDKLVHGYEAYHEQEKNADAVIMFSCQGREIALGPFVCDEIERVQKIWNAPLSGFFTFGEIGADNNGKIEFYNMTCSLVLLAEV